MMKPSGIGAFALACGVAAATLATPKAVLAQQAAQPQPPARDGAVALREVDIRAFIADVATATGNTFIIDPRVQGNVTVLAHRSLSEQELFQVFLSTLRVHGFVAVPTAQGAYRIVPEQVASREPSGGGAQAGENRFVTQVFQLKFADAESVATALRPLLSERGQATVSRRGNSVIIVDYGSTLSRLSGVISQLDQDSSAVRSVALQNTSAAEMARVATSLASALGDEQGGRSMVQAVPVPSSNSVVLRGDPRALERLSTLIRELDAGATYNKAVQVLPLRYAVAEELVPVLQQMSTSLAAAAPADGQTGAAQGRTANIASHRATNSLIISADPETQEALANIVQSLDVRREQVLVEAIIVEVSDSASRELGLQFLLSGDGSEAVPFLSTSYANSAPNLLAVTGAVAIDPDNLEGEALRELRRAAVNSLIGANGVIAGVGGTTDDGSILGLILNALAEDRDSNVLSTPSVMTLENETASILVGQQIPITTGETLSDANTNPFRTVRREDVGVKLEVRPQINEGGAIRLAIRQEVSSVFGPIISDSADLITNRRAIETVVQVDAGQVLVLGGLIQDDIQRSDSGVPLLRSIPIIGRLFRSEGRSRQRTNLMVFLRPTIVDGPEAAAAVTARQYRGLATDSGVDPAIMRQLDALMRDAEAGASAVAPGAAPAATPPPEADKKAPAPDRPRQAYY
jgi:general secretion pathway protein D